MTEIAQALDRQTAAHDDMSRDLRRNLIIGLIAFLTVVDLFATQAILPSLAKAYGVAPAAMGLAVNACTLGMAIAGLAVAFLSSRINRRVGIIVSLCVLAIPTAMLAGAPDVTSFAKVLTGWSIGGGDGRLAGGIPGRFFFREQLHQPGPQTLLGKTYRQTGEGQALAVLADLSRHPSTTSHLARKLVRHFIADDPPAPSVERIAAAFRGSDGHLPTTYRALIDSSEAWNPQPTKFKTPQDFIYSAYRAFDIAPTEQRALLAPFEILGQRIYSPGSPA